MKDDKHIIEKLNAHAPRLNDEVEALLWTRISEKLPPQSAVPSPFLPFTFSSLAYHRSLLSAFVILLVVITGGTTALAADGSRPGDVLFPLERVIENTRLHLTKNAEAKRELKSALSEKRIAELRELINEHSISDDVAKMMVPTTSTQAQKSLSKHGEERVGVAVDAILSFIDDTELEEIDREKMLEGIFHEIDAFALEVNVADGQEDAVEKGRTVVIRHDASGETRIDITRKNDRTRIEKKDGEVRVEVEKNPEKGVVEGESTVREPQNGNEGNRENTGRGKNDE